jgi:cytochrome P450
MISDLVRAEEKETLSNLDTLIFIMSLMVAGNETTTNLIGNTIVLLLENPEQLAKVQAQPALLKNAIEETLRYRSPVQFSIRAPVVDVELGGQAIRKDEPMVLVIGAANRDQRKYSNAEQFDVTRDTTRAHFAFGHGIHFCIGFHLARREAMVALGAIVPRLHEWSLPAAPLKRIDSNLVYGYQAIPLVPRKV